ncbi:5'-nucleotidase C-terminal domain-containing protein [Flammeovirga agarivorans]|uniref:UDP-sugar hydrolase n=1 Tax=Flammeovirga agarivorans TaxID=2726742 RepID=A0A7X8XWA9_9BACT|nr:5'-nucleotidase [Flammeovirga agarivorans]NLR92148.1 UDP-sugar hydrolase [Flammeovirga agarivorans]
MIRYVKIKTFTFYLVLLLFSSVSCKKSKDDLSKIDFVSNAMNEQIQADTSMTNFILPYKKELDAQMDQVIARVNEDLTIDYPNNKLGNFVCDLSVYVVEKETGNTIDLCIMNNGGFRASIFKGDISKRHAFKLMPFDNQLVIARLKGSDLEDLFEYVAEYKAPVSGIQLGIKEGKPYEPLVGGEKVDPNKQYAVLTTDYLFEGGDNMAFFKKSKNSSMTDILLRDAIIDYCVDVKEVKVNHGKRLYDVK